jgi:hypothetical protein
MMKVKMQKINPLEHWLEKERSKELGGSPPQNPCQSCQHHPEEYLNDEVLLEPNLLDGSQQLSVH